MQQLEESS